MLGIRGCQIILERKRRFVLTQRMTSGHPGSKRPSQRAHKQGHPGVRHNRALHDFNEKCYERGILHAVRRDFR